MLLAQYRARFALKEPNSSTKEKYISRLKSKLIGNANIRTNLKQAFKNKHHQIAQKMSQSVLVTSACRLAACQVYAQVLGMRKRSVGLMLRAIRYINAMEISPNNLGVQLHSTSSEPYFYDTAYTPVDRCSALPVDEYGRCISAEEVSCRDANTNRPTKWKCSEECRLPSEEDIACICSIKTLCQKPMEELRHGLDELDKNCPNVHHGHLVPADPCLDDMKGEEALSRLLLGHPLPCALGMCSSVLRTTRSAAVHYPRLRSFLAYFYRVRKHHQCISDIDTALSSGDFGQLMKLTDIKSCADLFGNDAAEHEDDAMRRPGLPNLETELLMKHTGVITMLEKQIRDDPEYACCSCERLHQRSSVTSLKGSQNKFNSGMWKQLQRHIAKKNPDEDFDSLWICQHCRMKLNENQMPSRCVLNGMETDPIPSELTALDSLSKQLIQRAKAFQTIVHLGTYTARVPKYNSLKACKGTMFFLPLPLSKTLETLEEVKPSSQIASKRTLPHPELYIMVNGRPSKQQVVWQSMVNVDTLKAAIQKLKEINWLYKDVDENDLDNVSREVIETVSNTTSTMLEKADKQDVAAWIPIFHNSDIECQALHHL